MKRSGKIQFRTYLSSLYNTLLRFVYYIVLFLIFVGEGVKVILFSLFLTVRFALTSFIKKLKRVKISFPVVKFPKIRLKFRFPKLKIPNFTFKKKFVIRVKRISASYPLSLRLRFFLLGSIVTLALVFLYQSYVFLNSLPSPYSIGKVNYSLSTHIYDRNGRLLYEIYREQNRTPIKLKDIPPYIAQATIAIEDKDFYRHGGISLFSGIFRALKDMIIRGTLQGGSTITQQLVKTALLTPERTIQRKIREIILAVWAERVFTKDQILEMYLNQVPYGGSSYGIEEAAKTYFDKYAKDLTLEEAATLAGLPQAPTLYSPYLNPQLTITRRNDVLEQMQKQGYIDENLKFKIKNLKLNVIPPKTTIKAPHFVFFVKSQLEEKYGIKTVEEGGLRVTTTLDLSIQEEAERVLKDELEKVKSLNVGNGAILVTRPPTGEILAMVGSSDYFSSPSGAFNVTTALRQPGSAIKPIMYSLALERGYTAATIIDDSPVVFNIPGSESYRPVNYDGRFHGKIPLRYALANSYNVPAVKTLSTIGVDNFIGHATKMGITTWQDPSRFGLSLTLGGGEVTMMEMAKAFGVLANLGYEVEPNYALRVQDTKDAVIAEINPTKNLVLDEGIGFIVSDILSDNFARQWAFGTRSLLEIPGYTVAVKTGTTNDKKDNWTIGYTPEFLTAVWVGNNDNSPMNPYLTSGITGAAPIWNKVMSYLLNKYSDGHRWYAKPDGVVERICYFGRKEYFLKGTENKVSCREGLFTPTPTPSAN